MSKAQLAQGLRSGAFKKNKKQPDLTQHKNFTASTQSNKGQSEDFQHAS